MKKFAVFDIDGTLIRWQLYHAVSSTLLRQGNNSELYESIKSARMKWKQRQNPDSFREYEHALVDAYDAVVQELSVEQFNAVAAQVFEEHKDQVYTFTRDLLKELKASGYFLLAISGSQQEIIAKIAKYYGFDDFIGTEFVQRGGRFTGEKIVPSFDKKTALRNLITKHHLDLTGSIAVGDSESDIPMLSLVEQPIVFNPTAALFAEAKKKRWRVVVERKNMIYELTPQSKDAHGSFILE